MDPVTIALAILLLPLGAFVAQIWCGWFLPRQGDWLPTGAMAICLVLSLVLFFGWFFPGGFNPQAGGAPIDKDVYTFFKMGEQAKGAGTTGRTEQAKINRGLGHATAVAVADNAPTNLRAFDDDYKPAFKVAFGIRLDNLTVLMLVVVTLVSFLVHLYSTSYMRDHHGQPEDRYNRFFAYLALFSCSMLGCVLSNSLLFTFMFWELVGVCSYFLIGFYFQKKSAARACVKAFMTTRIGDLGFLLALMIIFAVVGSSHYEEIFASVQSGAWNHLTWCGCGLLAVAGIALFLGPVGKSGQFPLHVWLPDAMEGPTPVSALIHAATMVAAGVYLLARMFPFLAGPDFYSGGDYLASSTPLLVIALTGGFTALFAATIALVQTDIKKVLAYSTVSQLGYMVMGIGTGSLVAGMFHLWTHAFFKALLFLASGSVIHAVHSNEMADMGGLRKKMPITFLTFAAGTLAIAGFPWVFSGFVSKDGILAGALAYGTHNGSPLHMLPFLFGITAACLTSFYMFRLLFLTFFGQPRDPHTLEHAHESPWQMTVPLIVLATLSTGLGAGITGAWFNDRLDPAALGYRDTFVDRMGAPHASAAEDAGEGAHGHGAKAAPHDEHGGREAAYVHAKHHWHWPVAAMSIVGALAGFFVSYYCFILHRGKDFIGHIKPLARYREVLINLYYIDYAYTRFVLGGLFAVKTILGLFDKYVVDSIVNLQGWLARGLSFVAGALDYHGVDGVVRGTGELAMGAGASMRQVQTGRLQDYLYMTVIALAGVFMLWVGAMICA